MSIMKVFLYVLTILVIGAFIKGGLDMNQAIASGEPAGGVFMGASPMLLMGLIALVGLTKTLAQMGAGEKGPSSIQPPDPTNSSK